MGRQGGCHDSAEATKVEAQCNSWRRRRQNGTVQRVLRHPTSPFYQEENVFSFPHETCTCASASATRALSATENAAQNPRQRDGPAPRLASAGRAVGPPRRCGVGPRAAVVHHDQGARPPAARCSAPTAHGPRAACSADNAFRQRAASSEPTPRRHATWMCRGRVPAAPLVGRASAAEMRHEALLCRAKEARGGGGVACGAVADGGALEVGGGERVERVAWRRGEEEGGASPSGSRCRGAGLGACQDCVRPSPERRIRASANWQ